MNALARMPRFGIIRLSCEDFVPHEGIVLPIPGFEAAGHRADLSRYRVNLIVEHQPLGGAPFTAGAPPRRAIAVRAHRAIP